MRARIRETRLAAIPEQYRESTFDTYRPRNPRQERTLDLMRRDPGGSFYLTGAYGSGKTYLLYAQYRETVMAGRVHCHVRTTRELVGELKRAELDDDFASPVLVAANRPGSYHLFWDDIDKLKTMNFKTEVLFDLVDNLYRRKHGLTVTGNHSPGSRRPRAHAPGHRPPPGRHLSRGGGVTAMVWTTSQFKPGDRVIWVRSPGRSILEGWKVEQVPGVVVGVCRHRVKISARFGEREKLATVDPENLIGDDENDDLLQGLGNSA